VALYRGKSLLYEQHHFTNVLTGPVARSDFIWWGILGGKKSVEFKPLNGLQRYLPTAMEYKVNNRDVNCNFPYLIDFDIHSEQKQITQTKPPFFAFSPSSKILKDATFRKPALVPFSGEKPNPMHPLDRANLGHWAPQKH
jgi:hypothetical protein